MFFVLYTIYSNTSRFNSQDCFNGFHWTQSRVTWSLGRLPLDLVSCHVISREASIGPNFVSGDLQGGADGLGAWGKTSHSFWRHTSSACNTILFVPLLSFRVIKWKQFVRDVSRRICGTCVGCVGTCVGCVGAWRAYSIIGSRCVQMCG